MWTLSDADLNALRRLPAGGPAVVTGLPRSGRDYAADILGSPLDGTRAVPRFTPDSALAGGLTAWLAGDEPLAVVVDHDDSRRGTTPGAGCWRRPNGGAACGGWAGHEPRGSWPATRNWPAN